MSFRTAVYRLELLAIRALLGCAALPKSVAPSWNSPTERLSRTALCTVPEPAF